MVDCGDSLSLNIPSISKRGVSMSLATPSDSEEGGVMLNGADEGVVLSQTPPISGECVRLLVLHDFSGSGDDELTLRRGQSVELLSTDETVSGGPGWWIGVVDGKVGVFPSNHVDNTEPPIISYDHLQLLELIGVGGFGKVYRGVWAGEEVAVKTTRHVLGDNWSDYVEQVRREAKLFWLLEHRNVVSLRGVVLTPPNLCLVMEYCRGGSLSSTLSQKKLLPHVLVDWAEQIADGMEYLHHGAPVSVIHRDLKSSNVLLDRPVECVTAHLSAAASASGTHTAGNVPDGATVAPPVTLKISDLGLAREAVGSSSSSSSSSGSRGAAAAGVAMTQAGTYAWMAPEAIEHSAYSRASDVWSYGVLLWELLTGETPYRGIDALAVAYGVASHRLSLPVPDSCPQPWHQLMLACWSRDPCERPSFRQIRRTLAAIGRWSLTVTDSSQFHDMQLEWRSEINTVLQQIRNRETELRSREVDLNRREQQLLERERLLLQREIQVFIHQQQQQQRACVPSKRQKSKLWSRSRLQGPINISGPSDFRHTASVASPCLACERENLAALRLSQLHGTWDPLTPLLTTSQASEQGRAALPMEGHWSESENGDGSAAAAAAASSAAALSCPVSGALFSATALLASVAVGGDVRQLISATTAAAAAAGGAAAAAAAAAAGGGAGVRGRVSGGVTAAAANGSGGGTLSTNQLNAGRYFRCKSASDVCDSDDLPADAFSFGHRQPASLTSSATDRFNSLQPSLRDNIMYSSRFERRKQEHPTAKSTDNITAPSDPYDTLASAHSRPATLRPPQSPPLPPPDLVRQSVRRPSARAYMCAASYFRSRSVDRSGLSSPPHHQQRQQRQRQRAVFYVQRPDVTSLAAAAAGAASCRHPTGATGPTGSCDLADLDF